MSKLILTTPEELQELIRVTLIDVLSTFNKGESLTNEKEIFNTDQPPNICQ